ncbi:DUF3800 domain-containing protein [Alloalcanivorax sp. C16-1]|uniref:DUF3800 domain-containing protein n=1 Tax=Alloalcanivorax sp. C16-1 TaxID=3390051 RepID=UPI0039709A5D
MSQNSKANREKKLVKERKKLRAARAKVKAQKNKIATIFMDESGNTGSNIIDKDQPIFTLSGCKYSNGEAKKLLALTGSKAPKEAHFKNLKRRKSGQDGIVRFMRHHLIKPDYVKVTLFHKDFMVTTKIVDLLIEPMMHRVGHDLYKNGENIALSNMWFFCMPVFCGAEPVRRTYESFVKMIKVQSPDLIENFYNNVEELKNNSASDEFRDHLDVLISTKKYIRDALEGIEKSSLDPSIPALFSQCVAWGKTHSKGFHVVHDDSHSIESQKLLFAQFMDWSQSSVELGYDRRRFSLPLKGKSLKFASSDKHAQLQVADIIASAVAYWAHGVARDEKEDYLFLELSKLDLANLVTHQVWPTQSVTPSELGTIHDGGLNPADHTAEFLMKANSDDREDDA